MADLTPHETVAHEALSLPVMVPPKLFGRDVTLGRVYAQLKDNNPVLLYGASGIGKTALASSLASAMTQAPGGVLWVAVNQAAQTTTLADILVRVARAYRLNEVTTKDNPLTMVNTVASTLANQRPLVVLDGSFSADVASAFIAQCANKNPVLLVNDDELTGSWTSLRLGKLEPEPAAALFRQTAGLTQTDATATTIIARLTQALDFQPFALVLSAATLKAGRQTPADFVNFLAGTPNAANLTPNQLALATAFRALDNRLRGLLYVLGGTYTGGASGELIGMIGGAPEETVNAAMNLLVARGLVEQFYRYDIAYFRLHPIVYAYTQNALRGADGKGLEELQTRVREACVSYARKYSADDANAHDKLSIEMDNLLAVARAAADAGDRQVADGLAVLLARAGSFVQSRGYVYELVTLQQMASSSRSAFPAHGSTPPAPVSTASPIDSPSVSPFELEDEEATDEDLDDLSPIGMTDADAALGLTDIDEAAELEDEADHDEMVETFDEDDFDDEDFDDETSDAPINVIDFDDLEDEDELEDEDDLAIEDEIEDEDEGTSVAQTLVSFGALDIDEDDPLAASLEMADSADTPLDITPSISPEIARLRSALMNARQSGDTRQQAALLASIGMAHMETGHDTEAISSYTEALTLYENLNDSFGMLSTLEALANLTARGDGGQAVVMYATRGIALAKELGREEAQARLLVVLGDVRQQSGDSDQAARVYGQALDLRRDADDARDEASILLKLGYAQLDSGEPDEAIKTWEEALKLFREQDRRGDEAKALGGIGTAYGELERWSEAINFHQSALHIAREVKDKEEEALQLGNLGYASVQANDLRQAVLRYRQALHLAFLANDRQNIVGITVDLARLLVESPRHLDIAALLVDAGLAVDPNDRDLRKLSERIEDERDALGDDAPRASVSGTAQQYAENAYRVLDE